MKNILIILALLISISSLEAQVITRGQKGKTSRGISMKAKTLSDKEKIEFATNNNNGRSNKDRCCGQVTASNNNQFVIFNGQSKWYLVNDSNGEQNLVDNPIALLIQAKNEWEVALRTSNGNYISQKLLGVQGNKMLLSITELADSQYYIELVFNGATYRTAFSKGKKIRFNNSSKPNTKNIKKSKGKGQ